MISKSKQCHIIIENESSYKKFKDSFDDYKSTNWHTTSPWLLEKLPKLGENVFSLEENISYKLQKELGKKCLLISKDISNEINKLLNIKIDNLNLGSALNQRIQWYLFVLLYKSMLLIKWYKKYNDCNHLVIVGDPKLSKISQFDIMDKIRFANLYSEIAHNAFYNEIQIIQNNNKKMEFDHASYFNDDYRYKILRILNKGIFKHFIDIFTNYSENFKINSTDRKFKNYELFDNYVMMKGCPLLFETINYLKNKTNVRIFNNVLQYNNLESFLQSLDLSRVALPFNDSVIKVKFREYLDNYFIANNEFIESSLDIITFQICRSLEYGLALINQFDSIYSSISSMVNGEFNVITNALETPYGRLFQEYLENKNVKFFVFDHAVTAGISETASKYTSIHLSKKSNLIAYNKSSAEQNSGSSNDNKCVISGAPKVNMRIKHPHFQKFLAKKILNIRKSSRNIIYLASCTRNNFMIPPVTMTDYDYFNHTKFLINNVFSLLNDNFLLKLYPSNRYVDPDPFSKLVDLPINVSVIEGFDYKIVRSCADIAIFSVTGSTFGWAWSSNLPVIFLEFPSNPIVPKVKDLFDRALFRFDTSKKFWEKELINLLSIPDDEFTHLWKSKSNARDELSGYIFGPRGNSGKRAADYIYKSVVEDHL